MRLYDAMLRPAPKHAQTGHARVPAMKEGPSIAGVAALIGDPARANMLQALMQVPALSASELAREAGVTAQTASGHLARLQEGGLLHVTHQGRHRYFRLAGPDVALAIEALLGIAGRTRPLRTRPGPRDGAMREARVCYDHLAGACGTRLFDSLVAGDCLREEAGGLVLTVAGQDFLCDAGITLPRSGARRIACRACLDWSERRSHLAGAAGAALLTAFLDRGWLRRLPRSRALTFTLSGRRAFEQFCTAARAASGAPAREAG